MKIDLNITKWFLDFELPPVDQLVEKIGAQLGAVEEVINVGERYEGIVIVKVMSCQPHPDADKLIVCMVDDGGVVDGVPRDKNGHVQIVSRALNEHGQPNVREETLVAWIPPGKVVPRSYDENQLVLEARDMRGVKSHGMLTSGYELAISDDHSGVLALEGDIKPGTAFAKAFDRQGDFVIDIENKMFTHRPDCFGFMGVARELAGIYHKPFKSPKWYMQDPEFPKPEADELKLTFKNELSKLVPRFALVTLSNVRVGPSSLWVQDGLSRLGQKSVNSIVDYTNWYMLETGQPLHAYDYDKVKALSGGEAAIVVRHPKKGEKIKLLNGKEIEPRSEAIMIATDKQLIGVGGVMGGADTEVDENTKNIILECANFDMYSIRRTSMEHGLFTDAVTRFTKGQSPRQNLAVLSRIVQEIREHDDGKVASPLIDDKHDIKPSAPVKVTADFINQRLGEKLTAAEMKKLLENVEFQVAMKGNELAVTAPFWRTDIEIPEDIVEEVGRLYGYDHLPQDLPKRDLTPATKDLLLELKSQIRGQLAKAGANEVLTYSFVHGDLLSKVGQDKAKAYQVANALSPDLQYYRLSLIPSLLEKVHPNVKAGYDQFALFELGKTHSASLDLDADGLPQEFDAAALIVTASGKTKKTAAAYYEARKYLTSLVGDKMAFKPIPEKIRSYSGAVLYDPNRSALIEIDGQGVGLIGEFKASVKKALKLPAYTAGFEIDIQALQSVFVGSNSYVALPRFPKVTQDITLKVSADLAYQELYDFAFAELARVQPKNTLPKLSPLDIFQSQNDKKHKNVTFRLEIASYDRTLTDPEVNKLLDAVAAAAHKKFGAERA